MAAPKRTTAAQSVATAIRSPVGWGIRSTLLTDPSDEALAIEHALRNEEVLADRTRRRGDSHQKQPDIGETTAQTASREWDLDKAHEHACLNSKAGAEAVVTRRLLPTDASPLNKGTAAVLFPDFSGVPGGRSKGACLAPRAIKERKVRAATEFGIIATCLIPSMTSSVQARLLQCALACGHETALHMLLPLAGKHLPESIEYTPNEFRVEHHVDPAGFLRKVRRAERRSAHPLVVCAELQPALIVPALAHLEWDTDDLVAAIVRLDKLLSHPSSAESDKVAAAQNCGRANIEPIGRMCLEGYVAHTEQGAAAGMAGLQAVERGYVEALCECAALLALELAKCATRAHAQTGAAGAGAVLRLIKHEDAPHGADGPLKAAFVTHSRALRDVILSPRWRDVWTREEIVDAHRFVLTNGPVIFSPSFVGFRLNCGRLDAVVSYCALLEHPHTPRSLKITDKHNCAEAAASAISAPPMAEYTPLFMLIRGRIGWENAPEGDTGWTLLALVCTLLPTMLCDLHPNATNDQVDMAADMQRLSAVANSHGPLSDELARFRALTGARNRTESNASATSGPVPRSTTVNPILKAVLDAVLKAHDWSRLARWRAIEAAVHVCALHTRRIVQASEADRSNGKLSTRAHSQICIAEATCHQIVDALLDSMQSGEEPLTKHDCALFQLKESKAPLLAGILPSWPDAPRPVPANESEAAFALRRYIDQQLADMGLGATVRLCESTGAVLTAPDAKGPLVRGCAAAHISSAAWDPEAQQLTELVLWLSTAPTEAVRKQRTCANAAVLLIVRDIASYTVAMPLLARKTFGKALDRFKWDDNELFRLLLMIGVSTLSYSTKQLCCQELLTRMQPTAARALLRAKAPRMFACARRPRAEIAAAAADAARASPYGPQIGADPAHSWVVHARICDAHDTMLAWVLTCFPTAQHAILREAGYLTDPIPRGVCLQILDQMLAGGASGYGRASMRTFFPDELECADVERCGLGFARMWRPRDSNPDTPVEMRTDAELAREDALRFLCDDKTTAFFRAWRRPASIGHSPQRPGSALACAQALLIQRVLCLLLKECANRDPHFSFPNTRTMRWSDAPEDAAEVDVLETVAAMFPAQLGAVFERLVEIWSPGAWRPSASLHAETGQVGPSLETMWPQWWARVGGRARFDSLLDAVLRAARHLLDRGFGEEAELIVLVQFLIGPCRCRVRSYAFSFDENNFDERTEAVLLDAWRTKALDGHGPEGRAKRWTELGVLLEWDDDPVQARDGTLPPGWRRAANAWVQARGVQPGAAGAPSKAAAAPPERGRCRIRHIPAEYKPGERLRLCTSWGVFAFTVPNGVEDGVGITVELAKPQKAQLTEQPDFVSLSRFGEAGAAAPDDDEPVVTAHRDPADWTNDPEKKRRCIDLVSDDDEEAARKKPKAGAGGCA